MLSSAPNINENGLIPSSLHIVTLGILEVKFLRGNFRSFFRKIVHFFGISNEIMDSVI